MTKRSGQLISIGDVAKAAGMAATALRYYEREGILRSSARSPAGYRLYDRRSVEQLGFIRAAQAVGFTLSDIRLLLEVDGARTERKADVQQLIRTRLADVEQKMRDLRRVRAALAAALEGCERSKTAECPVLEELHGTGKGTNERRNGFRRRPRNG